jgi:hypothetical protein
VRDWAKLAPSLGLRAELGVRTLLLAPSFDPRTQAAALSLGPELIELSVYRCVPTPMGISVSLERQAGDDSGARRRGPRRPLSTFRTGLQPEDLTGPALRPA